jgi:DNA-binding NarL/FixJ family response regulator
VIRILLADDQRIFRSGLKKLLEDESDFAVVGEASNGPEAVILSRQLKPDILLLSVTLPVMSGLQVLSEIRPILNGVRPIMVTGTLEKMDIIEGLRLGACGFISKDSDAELLFKGIRRVVAGEFWIRRQTVVDIVTFLREEVAPTQSITRSYGLTPREFEIVGTIVDGQSNKDIGKKYSISTETVKHHLTNIFNKTGASNRLELALFAVNRGLSTILRERLRNLPRLLRNSKKTSGQ